MVIETSITSMRQVALGAFLEHTFAKCCQILDSADQSWPCTAILEPNLAGIGQHLDSFDQNWPHWAIWGPNLDQTGPNMAQYSQFCHIWRSRFDPGSPNTTIVGPNCPGLGQHRQHRAQMGQSWSANKALGATCVAFRQVVSNFGARRIAVGTSPGWVASDLLVTFGYAFSLP